MKFKTGFPRLLVSNFEACFLFYRDVLELDVTRSDEEGGEADFKTGNLAFGLFRRQEMAEIIGTIEKPSDAECQDRVALIFEVQDLDALYQELRHKGVTFLTEPMSKPYWKITTAYF